MKNLYLISQKENNGYDTYDSAVVCAESEETARTTSPNGDTYDPDGSVVGIHGWNWCGQSWVSNCNFVKVELLATNVQCKLGVVLASYNAG